MRFEPDRGTVLVEAPAAGPGNWAGAPGAWREGTDLFVTYRLRRLPPARGYELRVGVLRGGRLETLVRIEKSALSALSIERSALVHERDEWRLYVSYVDAVDHKWRVGALLARSVDGFDARHGTTVLHPDPLLLAAVKDPWLRRVDGTWYMFVSCGRRSGDPALHTTADALSTGAVRSETGLATSGDGLTFTWRGIVFSPSSRGWDRSTSRLTTAWRSGGEWSAYYDGAASLAENYEERCGVARSPDLRQWQRVSHEGPVIGTPRGPGGVRYVDVTDAGDVLYEYTRADGAHELRGIVSASTPAAG